MFPAGQLLGNESPAWPLRPTQPPNDFRALPDARRTLVIGYRRRYAKRMDYPWTDQGWLASDPKGRLAIFILAGQGPIPAEALSDDLIFSEIEDMLLRLPCIAEAVVHDAGPSDSEELSRRGVFVYDWTDCGASSRGYLLDAYELMTSPSVLLGIEQLPPPLRKVAERVRLDTEFGDVTVRVDGVQPEQFRARARPIHG